MFIGPSRVPGCCCVSRFSRSPCSAARVQALPAVCGRGARPNGSVQRRLQGQSVIGVSAALGQHERGLGIRPPPARPGQWRSACASPACGAAFQHRRRFVGFASERIRAAGAAAAPESVEFQRTGDLAVGHDSWGLRGPSAAGQDRGLACGGRARPAWILSSLVQAFLSLLRPQLLFLVPGVLRHPLLPPSSEKSVWPGSAPAHTGSCITC